MNALPTIAFALILVSAVVQAPFLFRKDGKSDPASHWALLAAFVSLAAVTVYRSFAIGFPALTGTFESLVFLSAFICSHGLDLGRMPDSLPPRCSSGLP